MARLLNSLRECKRPGSHRYPISAAMLSDIQWWLDFLPLFPRVSLIKSSFWDFENFHFSNDACFHGEAPFVTPIALALFFLITFHLLPSISVPWNFLRSLLLSSTGHLSYLATNLLLPAMTPPHMRSSILPLSWILSCSAVFDNFGSPPLFSISKCAHNIFLANTISSDYLSRWHSDPSARASFDRIRKASNQ